MKVAYHRETMRQYFANIPTKYKKKYISVGQFTRLEGVMFRSFDAVSGIRAVKLLEPPNFLLTEDDRLGYTGCVFGQFYEHFRAEKKIGLRVKSQDEKNRQRLPASHLRELSGKFGWRRVRGAQLPEIFPLNHSEARRLLVLFVKKALVDFGPYQDYIHFSDKYLSRSPVAHSLLDTDILYHSLLSIPLGVGLITPTEILTAISAVKSKVPISSYEGFVRQLFWREYAVYIHTQFEPILPAGGSVHLTSAWYNGSTGILPVDLTIKKAFAVGYLHHIERLMVMGNFMLLSGQPPRGAIAWFREFSLDGYDYLMTLNVLGMVYHCQFRRHGSSAAKYVTRKYYISSSNYIEKMSNISTVNAVSPDWKKKWDQLFHLFAKKHNVKLFY